VRPAEDDAESADADPEFAESEVESLQDSGRSLPDHTLTRSGQQDDVVNLAFIGTRDQVQSAFESAGWLASDRWTKGTFFREMSAAFVSSNYPRVPMLSRWIDGREPDFTLEKNLNSWGKRDHMRVWSMPQMWLGQPLWVSSSVAETGYVLSLRRRRLIIHKVNRQIDEERDKVLRDLSVAGCVDACLNVARPDLLQSLNAQPIQRVQTDGALTVIRLKDCDGPPQDPFVAPQIATRPHSTIVRLLRVQILSFRGDVWPTNLAHTGIDMSRGLVHALRIMSRT
jgi:hypothetical protein